MKLELQNIVKRYGTKTALCNVSAKLTSGSLIGLVGPNGAGKSTLLSLLATLAKPTEGDILLNGQSIVAKPSVMRHILGYVPQTSALYANLSAREFLRYMAAAKGVKPSQANTQIEALLVRLHLMDTGRKPISAFSGGMQRRVSVAAALLGDPQIIIADEPTTGLDPQERVALRGLFSELATQRIVLLSTHIVSDVEAVAGKIILLQQGRVLFDGTPGTLVQNAEGSVWEYTLPEGETPPVTLAVSALVQTANGLRVRAVSQVMPCKEAVSCTPSLEDACLAALGRE